MNLRTRIAASVVVCNIVAFQNVHAATPNVVELTADTIESDLATGKYTAQELVQAYLNRINQYNGAYNAFTYLSPTALADAAAIDAQLAASGGVIPADKPLLGVPIVIKDSMNVAGVRTTGG